MIIQPVRDALDYYRRLNEASQPPRHRKSTDVTSLQAVHPPAPSTSPATSSDNACDKNPSSSTEKTKRHSSSTAPEEEDSDFPPPSPSVKSPPASTTTPESPSVPSQPPLVAPPAPPEVTTDGPPAPSVQPMGHRNSNPLSYRRASQLLMLKASGSSNSLKVAGLIQKPGQAAANFQSFPSLESESDREGEDDPEASADSDDGEEEEAITEVAVSEKALKFKIATEPSFDYSAQSRKGSRENKSESSGQSTVAPSREDRISFDTSLSASTPKVDFVSVGATSIMPSPRKHHHAHHLSASCKGAVDRNVAASQQQPGPGSSGGKGGKSKDSFFSRLKLFTERLSISADSTGSGGSGCESPPGSGSSYKHHSISYFRNKSKDSKRRKGKEAGGLEGARGGGKHRGSSSDPEGQNPQTEGDKLSVEGGAGGSELVSPECSPALSGASGGQRRSSWKHCSGSLDSVLSKDEHAKRSPSRRLMLPRFSSFVQKKTRMGFMMGRRSSPKGSSTNTNEPPQS